MLNRNDRNALKRNRIAVSWLTLVIIILCIISISFFRESSDLHASMKSDLLQLEEYQNEIIRKNKTIDSLDNELNNCRLSKDTMTKPIVRNYNRTKEVKIDTITFSKVKQDTSNKILKDSLK